MTCRIKSASVGFIAGLSMTAGLVWAADGGKSDTISQIDEHLRKPLLSIVYAITALSIDTEIVAIDVVELDDRISRLEHQLRELKKAK
jgi:hypothetical protein